MSERLLELAMRQGMLKARIDEQRRMIAQQAQPLRQALEKGDLALQGVDWLKQHPTAVGAAVAAFLAVRPRRAWRWLRRGFFLWRGWKAVQKSLLLGGRP